MENDPLVCKRNVPCFGFGDIFPPKCSMIMGRFRGEVCPWLLHKKDIQGPMKGGRAKLVGGFKHCLGVSKNKGTPILGNPRLFFTPKIGEDEPILTSIFFKWVETVETTN